jgi:hypothetical protein
MVPTAACVPFSEVRLQDRGQPGGARAVVPRYVPEFEKRWSRYARPVSDSS